MTTLRSEGSGFDEDSGLLTRKASKFFSLNLEEILLKRPPEVGLNLPAPGSRLRSLGNALLLKSFDGLDFDEFQVNHQGLERPHAVLCKETRQLAKAWPSQWPQWQCRARGAVFFQGSSLTISAVSCAAEAQSGRNQQADQIPNLHSFQRLEHSSRQFKLWNSDRPLKAARPSPPTYASVCQKKGLSFAAPPSEQGLPKGSHNFRPESILRARHCFCYDCVL